jgi:MYXO-CTERM domain-containing protein
VPGHWYSNTAFRNSADFNMLGLNGNVGILRNNLAYGGTLLANGSGVDDASNSWSLPVSVSDADFESVSTTGMDGPRQADGNLPRLGFLHLQAGSDLIDKGQDVGLPFNDAAPDLGAFESGPPLAGNAGTGGIGGSGAGGASMVGSGGVGAGGIGVGTSGAGARGSAGTGATTAASSGGSGGIAGQAPVSVAGSAGSGGAAPTTNAGASGGQGPISNSSGGGCSCRVARGPARVPISLWLALLAFAARRRWSLERADIAN